MYCKHVDKDSSSAWKQINLFNINLLTIILRALVSLYANDTTDYKCASKNQDRKICSMGKTGLELSISQFHPHCVLSNQEEQLQSQ